MFIDHDESPLLFPDTANSTDPQASSTDPPANDVSMELGEISFEVPPQIMESSIEDDTPRLYDGENLPLPAVTTYEAIRDGSQKGKEKLADSEGYTYTLKTRRANGNQVWRCSVRNKSVWCKATVQQKDDDVFTRGSQPHVHPAELGAAKATRISSAVKKIAATEIFTSAAEIVNKVRILYRVYKKSLLSLRSKTSVFSLYFQVYYTAQQQTDNLLITDFINLTNWDAIVPWNALSYYGLSFLLV